MKPVRDELEERISDAMKQCSHSAGIYPAIVTISTGAKFGDYQANGIMPLAKKLKTNPKKLAEDVVKNLDIDDICEPPEVAGPGFINLRLKPDFVADHLLKISKDQKRLGIEKVSKPKTIVVDFSGPNIAKQMHVGHLRSTIIGDCICRVLEFLGHKVIRQNHIGDWGLPMGMIVFAVHQFGYKEISEDQLEMLSEVEDLDLDILENYYRKASQLEKEDHKAADSIRNWTLKLQNGDDFAEMYWELARRVSLRACFEIYGMLGVKFAEEDICGESFYADKLAHVAEDLKKQKLSKESDGAICVFPEGFKNKEGEALPFIIQKSDGAYLYATTDLAALKYRIEKLNADRIIYVTDARQKLHFDMLFAVAEMAGWTTKDKLKHVTFGSVLGENGKPLKTREGENVKLKELLDEAVQRAEKIVEEKNPDLPADKKAEIAKAVGIGAVKYADFSNNRTSDYVFSFNKMLAMDGNTAPYMQYAYARIKSIERKAQTKNVDIETELSSLKELNLTEPAELDLAKHLIRYGEAIQDSLADYRPNYLTAYLYELAQKFSVFYTNCPVLDAAPDKRPTRLLLCDLTAETIKHGLSELLGIEVVEQM